MLKCEGRPTWKLVGAHGFGETFSLGNLIPLRPWPAGRRPRLRRGPGREDSGHWSQRRCPTAAPLRAVHGWRRLRPACRRPVSAPLNAALAPRRPSWRATSATGGRSLGRRTRTARPSDSNIQENRIPNVLRQSTRVRSSVKPTMFAPKSTTGPASLTNSLSCCRWSCDNSVPSSPSTAWVIPWACWTSSRR